MQVTDKPILYCDGYVLVDMASGHIMRVGDTFALPEDSEWAGYVGEAVAFTLEYTGARPTLKTRIIEKPYPENMKNFGADQENPAYASFAHHAYRTHYEIVAVGADPNKEDQS